MRCIRFIVFVCGRSAHQIRQVRKVPLTEEDGFYHPDQQASATSGAGTRSETCALAVIPCLKSNPTHYAKFSQ